MPPFCFVAPPQSWHLHPQKCEKVACRKMNKIAAQLQPKGTYTITFWYNPHGAERHNDISTQKGRFCLADN